MNDALIELVRELNAIDSEVRCDPEGRMPKVFPPYLERKERRTAAARQLRAYLPTSALASAALMRAALSDPEENVRKQSLLGLFHARSDGLEMALLAATLDPDDRMRRLALEGLAAIGSPKRKAAATLLADDADPDVAQAAADILSGRAPEYFQLEEP